MLIFNEIPYLIEPLNKQHNRSKFSCGILSLDKYLKEQALQDKTKYVTAPFVVNDLKNNRIIGYYTLSASSVNLEDLPSNLAKKLPKYPLVPVILLGRLAIDLSYQKHGWGDLLLMNALHRSFNSEIAAMGLIVDAINEQAIRFYSNYGFQSFPDHNNCLLLPRKTIKSLFN